MATFLSAGTLGNGASIDVIRATEQDRDLSDRICSMLGHKGTPWMWHIDQIFAGRTAGLHSRFYLARCGEVLAANVSMFINGLQAVIGHVFTSPDHRKQGIARILLQAAMDDARTEGFEVVCLNTEFESMPWRLYESIGFEGICPSIESGGMIRFLDDSSWDSLFDGTPETIRPADWRDYVGIQLLMGCPAADCIRSVHMPVYGRQFSESGFLKLIQRQTTDGDCRSYLLSNQSGRVYGLGVVDRDPLWGNLGRGKVLDVFIHPNGYGLADALMERIASEHSSPLFCYCDSVSSERITLLTRHGFRPSRLAGVIRTPNGTQATADIVFMTKDAPI